MTLTVPADLPRLAKRSPQSHKGTFGRALLIGGSRGMSGSIALSGIAALKSGAGLVKIATPEVCLDTVASFDPCLMTLPLECDEHGRISTCALEHIQQYADEATCVAVGPGMGRSEGLNKLVGWLYRILRQPLVIDADALNALAATPNGLSHPGGPRILTPHPGEFARLQKTVGNSIAPQQLASDNGVVVVLKGHQTLVTDGQNAFHNTTGNPGMATGGSGDVLTGVITALICQGLKPWDAARLGVFAHGLAGDLASETQGEVGVTASDIAHYLPAAWRKLEG